MSKLNKVTKMRFQQYALLLGTFLSVSSYAGKENFQYCAMEIKIESEKAEKYKKEGVRSCSKQQLRPERCATKESFIAYINMRVSSQIKSKNFAFSDNDLDELEKLFHMINNATAEEDLIEYFRGMERDPNNLLNLSPKLDLQPGEVKSSLRVRFFTNPEGAKISY